ncbi:MAG: amidohydrolase family protein [Exilispira sp.]
MIYLANCIYKNKFALIGIDREKGVFSSIKIYEDDKFSKNMLLSEFGENFELVKIERLFESNNEEILKCEKLSNEHLVFNCNGMLILPGAIDPHVHFDTPGYDFREDFSSASAAAIAGGVTTIIDMPCTSIPPVTNRKNFNEKLSIISNMSYCDFAFFGGICGKTIEEKNFENNITDLISCGVKGFKSYLISGMESFPRITNYQLYKAARTCYEVKKPLLLHAEDYEFIDGYIKEFIKQFKKKISDNQQNYSYLSHDMQIKLYCESRSDLAELIAVGNAAAVAEKTGATIHIVHLSSKKAVDFIKSAKRRCDITFETAPHYLQWTEENFEEYGSIIKTAPPVKKLKDKIALRKSLYNGQCLFIASDHAACKLEEKNTGSFLEDYGGINGVQTIYQYIISEFLDKIPIERLIQLTSENAAKFYGIYPVKGAILKGSDADFVLIEKDKRFRFNNNMLYSKMKISPFNNFLFNHKIYATFLRGKPAYFSEKGILINKGEGKYI